MDQELQQMKVLGEMDLVMRALVMHKQQQIEKQLEKVSTKIGIVKVLHLVMQQHHQHHQLKMHKEEVNMRVEIVETTEAAVAAEKLSAL